MVVEQSQTAVSDYLTAVKNQDYGQAYDQLCQSERERYTRSQYTRMLEVRPRIDSFTVAQPEVSENVVVPATLVYSDGTAQTVKYVVEQDPSSSDFEVCGEVD